MIRPVPTEYISLTRLHLYPGKGDKTVRERLIEGRAASINYRKLQESEITPDQMWRELLGLYGTSYGGVAAAPEPVRAWVWDHTTCGKRIYDIPRESNQLNNGMRRVLHDYGHSHMLYAYAAIHANTGDFFDTGLSWVGKYDRDVTYKFRILPCEEFLEYPPPTRWGQSIRKHWGATALDHGYVGPLSAPGQARSMRHAFQALDWPLIRGPRVLLDKTYPWRVRYLLRPDCFQFKSPFEQVRTKDFMHLVKAMRGDKQRTIETLRSLAANKEAIIDEAAAFYAIDLLAGLGEQNGSTD